MKKQELINKMQALIDEANNIEDEIRKLENAEYSDEDLHEMRKTIYARLVFLHTEAQVIASIFLRN